VVEKLEALLNRRAEKVRDIPEDKINAVIDEAVYHARHNRRSGSFSIRISSSEPMPTPEVRLGNCSFS
jgi:hypothetical protein